MALQINRNHRLPEGQYFHEFTPKSGICLHHTVGGSALSTINYWAGNAEMVGTAYIIERDGVIYEVFDPRCWAWQCGLKWPDEQRIAFEKRFIGIELASEGGLIEHDGELYCFDRISERTRKDRAEAFDYGQEYRGYRYFDRYEPPQVAALVELVNHLCDEFGIERQVPADYLGFHGTKLANFEGVIGHVNIRLDKSDPAPDVEFWEAVINGCRLERVSIFNELEELFEHNIQQLSQLNRAAAAVVKGLLYELQRGDRDTYIKLYDPAPGGHVIHYKLIRGNPDLVRRLAGALGFKTVTENTLEVFHG